MTGILWLTPISPLSIPTRYPNTQTQCIALVYGCDRADYKDLIGLPVSVALMAECWNDEVQAVSAILPIWLPCKNLNPHIAISWTDESAPVKANLMLESEHQVLKVKDEALTCMVEFLEWKPAISPRNWSDRLTRKCKQKGCDQTTRSVTGYCRNHRPSKQYRKGNF